MGLAKKGSREIDVDGVTYRWALSPDSGYAVLVAELYDGSGQRLEAQTTYGSEVGHSAAVTPHGVAKTIRLALTEGWQPASRGLTPFRLDQIDKRVDFSDRS